jgi:lactose/L-arabinose transport system ATP-binding protein
MSGVSAKNITKRYGDTEVIHGIELDIKPGEFCVFVGPSGCGKSTLLRMIAGLEEITSGELFIGDRQVTQLPPADRGVAMVFQSYALYPHMTVEENMGFGLKMNNVPKNEVKEKVLKAAKILQLDEFLARKPKALSGGQRQRVAIGRAIVRGPEVFLFDEPLSNLDAELRVDMRVEIARLHKKLEATMIYVTHDQVEAMTLADKIVVLRDGNVEQVGAPLTLFEDPDNRFVAGFIGSPSMNFLTGVVIEGGVSVEALGDITILSKAQLPAIGVKVIVGIRPQFLSLKLGDGPLKVDLTEELGGAAYAYLNTLNGERIVVEMRGKQRFDSGDLVTMTIDASEVLFFDKKTELRIR